MSSGPLHDERAASFLVCGLGRLGQQCVLLLKEFEVAVFGLDLTPPSCWQTPELPHLLDGLIVGDCRHVDVLKRAEIAQCRAVLLLTGNARTNIAAAFAARSLKPDVRLIIRSAQENLNQLLREQMGNLVAFEPSQFSANVFALASLGDETQALLEVGDEKVRVARRRIRGEEGGVKGRLVAHFENPSRRILSHTARTEPPPASFHTWDPEDLFDEGDMLTFVENADRLTSPADLGPVHARDDRTLPPMVSRLSRFRAKLKSFWRRGAQVRRVAIASSMIMLGLVLAGVFLYRWENPDLSWFDAINVSVVLGVGGFDNVFGALHLPFPISPGLYLFSVIVKISSAVFLGILFALMTERILSARLQIAHRRPHAPLGGHTIIIGMGVIGQRIAAILSNWRRPIIGLSEQALGADILLDMPIEIGPLREALERANVKTAKCVVVVTDDEVANLEISLMTRSVNKDCTLVFRTADQQFARNVASLIPASIGIGDYAVAAEAIAGASFGENILSAFHLEGRSVLVAEYTVEPGDTLIDRLLAEVAYGYGVTPIAHQRGDAVHVIPSDDIRLKANDRIVLLATINGLRRIEKAQLVPPNWFLRIEKSPSRDADFEASNAIALISGCDIPTARAAMTHLPATFGVPLYRHQGLRLARELRMSAVTSRLEPTDSTTSAPITPLQG